MLRSLGVLVVCSSVYGFALGSAHSPLYAQRNLLKLPLLFVVTAMVCALSYIVVARALTPRLSGAAVVGLVIRMFRDMSVLLASLSPVTYFLAQVAIATDDGLLGDYYLLFGLNTAFVAIAGSLALVRQARGVIVDHAVERVRGIAVVLCWLALSLFVGGQASFYLRPFFGLPATRGGSPPFALGTEPDVRGATNFYEAVIQIVETTPLPAGFGPRQPR